MRDPLSIKEVLEREGADRWLQCLFAWWGYCPGLEVLEVLELVLRGIGCPMSEYIIFYGTGVSFMRAD